MMMYPMRETNAIQEMEETSVPVTFCGGEEGRVSVLWDGAG
jgi:hypothetical protein